MGRLAKESRPPASGAVIFYGTTRNQGRPSAAVVTNPHKSNFTTTKAAHISESFTIDSTGSSTNSSGSYSQTFSGEDSLSTSSSSSLPLSGPQSHSPNPPGKKGSATAIAILSLVRDICEVFDNVPYIKIAAGLVQQIIVISDEIKTNKDRSRELVDKVLTYSRVVFDGLLRLQKIDFRRVDELKEDLLGISSVFQSIYTILQNQSSSSTTTRLGRLIYRDDIAATIAEQDRRLDVTITAFQIKSSIVLRAGNKYDSSKRPITLALKPTKLPRRTRGLRAKPQIVFGRSEELDAILAIVLKPRDNPWFETCPRICILGPGGIGKTTLALSIAHNKLIQEGFKDDIFFVSCEAATSPDLLLSEIGTTLNVVEDVKDGVLELIRGRLKQRTCLLILDNFETPWDPPETRTAVEGLLSEITSIRDATIILTMRGSQQPADTVWTKALPPLRPINLQSAVSVFETIAYTADKYAVDLIKAVDCVPLAVTLIANMAAVDGESTKDLWSRWEQESISMVGDSSGEDRMKSVEFSVQLSLSSPRMQREPGALVFLSAISILPDGISPEIIQACEKGLPDIISVKRAISILRQNALIYDSSQNLHILSPIRHYIRSRYPPSPQSQQFLQQHFLNLALDGTSYHDPTIRARLQKESGNINAMLLDALTFARDDHLLDIVKAIVHFCHYTYVTGKGSTQAIAHAVERLKKLQAPTAPTPVVPSLEVKHGWNRSFRLLQISSLQLKPKKNQADFNTNETMPHVDPALKLQADCLGCWGQILSRQSKFDEARQKFEMAKNLHIKAGDTVGHAYDVLNIGLSLSRDMEASEEVLKTFEDAIQLHGQIGDKAGKAYGFMGAGHLLRTLYRFDKAEAKFQEAISLFDELGDDSGQASALNGAATVKQSISRFAEAERYFTDATKICASIGDLVGQAENMSGIAVSHLLRSRFSDAHAAIDKAISLRHPDIEPDHLHILGRVFIAEAKYEQARETLTQSLALHRLLADARGEADDLAYLSVVSFVLGERGYSIVQSVHAYNIYCRYSELLTGDIQLLGAQICMRDLQFQLTQFRLDGSMAIFKQLSCLLGEAQCLYQWATFDLRMAKYEDATEKLTRALSLHTQVGNIQGQADDMNKICEVIVSNSPKPDSLHEATKLVSEALALHIEIGDQAGQGDDLYILATIFAAQGRFTDAEQTMKRAVEMHERGSSIYGIARDLASLGDILWQKHNVGLDKGNIAKDDQGVEGLKVNRGKKRGIEEDYDQVIVQAMHLFKKMGAGGEFFECAQQRRRMNGIEVLDIKEVSLPDWNYGTEVEEWSLNSDQSSSEDLIVAEKAIVNDSGSDEDFHDAEEEPEPDH